MILNEQQYNQNGIILLSENYQGEGKSTPSWNEVSTGFKIAIQTFAVPTDWWGWSHFGAEEGDSFGNSISKEEIILGGQKVYKRIDESRGNFSTPHVLTTLVIPNKDRDEAAEIWLLSKKSDSNNYDDILNEIAKHFRWND